MVRATNTGPPSSSTTVGWSRMRWSASAGVLRGEVHGRGLGVSGDAAITPLCLVGFALGL